MPQSPLGATMLDAASGLTGVAADMIPTTPAEAMLAATGGVLARGLKPLSSMKTPDYSRIPDPNKVSSGANFTASQKPAAYELNRAQNKGHVTTDISGTRLSVPEKSQRGVTPSPNEAQLDHVVSRARGGTNASRNMQVLSRKESRMKWMN